MTDPRDLRIEDLEHDNARLRRLLDSQNVPASLRHQVRNMLGLMRAILRRSAESSSSLAEYAAHVEGRFDALLRVQTLLINALDAGVSLHSLLADELMAHVIHEGDQATIDGPPIGLGPKSAQLLGLAFHELATNAVKFGAMTTPSGRIRISWTIAEGAQPILTLIWTETGLATPAVSPTFRGFGVEALEKMLNFELKAVSALEFRPSGLYCTIRLPLPQLLR
jgi:two-component sensor histidine kinase